MTDTNKYLKFTSVTPNKTNTVQPTVSVKVDGYHKYDHKLILNELRDYPSVNWWDRPLTQHGNQ